MAASNSLDVTVRIADGEADCLKDLNVNTGPGKERIADFSFSVRFVFKERDMRAICILNHNNDYLRMFSVRLSKERDLNMVNLMRE